MKSKNKKESAKGGKIIGIIIGIFIILASLYSPALYLFGGETAAYDITPSLRKTERDGDKEYYVSYSYTVNGKEYNGTDNVRVESSKTSPSYDKTVHYFAFAPGISSLYAEDALSVWTLFLFALGVGLILFIAIPKKKEKTKKRGNTAESAGAKKATPEPSKVDWDGDKPVTMAYLMEHTDGYDDNLEKYYQNGWDKNDPSWQCTCGKWNTENFCEKCGKPRK